MWVKSTTATSLKYCNHKSDRKCQSLKRVENDKKMEKEKRKMRNKVEEKKENEKRSKKGWDVYHQNNDLSKENSSSHQKSKKIAIHSHWLMRYVRSYNQNKE